MQSLEKKEPETTVPMHGWWLPREQNGQSNLDTAYSYSSPLPLSSGRTARTEQAAP